MARDDAIISFSALARIQPWRERLGLRPGFAGAVWLPRPREGIERRRTRIYYHRHEELEANLVLAGHGTYLVGDRLVPFSAGSLLWLFPGADHCLVRHADDLQYVIAVWRPELVRQATAGAPAAALAAADDPALGARSLDPAVFRTLAALCRDVAACADAATANAGLAWLLLRLWQAYAQATGVPVAGDLHPAVALAARLLREDADADLGEIAHRAGLSPDHLTRLFRRQLGCAPVAYRQQRRLDRVLDGLRPGQSLHAAALAAGFGSYAQFHRVFTRHLGISPRVWLERRH